MLNIDQLSTVLCQNVTPVFRMMTINGETVSTVANPKKALTTC